MTPDRWQAVGDLFDQALALEPAERAPWLERACSGDTELHREVLSLLKSHDSLEGGFVQKQIKEAVVSFYDGDSKATQRAGPYRLVRELGRGGMGTVYLAERDDDAYQTKVAIKLVRPGMDTEFILSRFRRERQTLARLQHHNIARLLDGGTTDSGLPYIVMEYVDGPPITEYVRKHELGMDDAIRLFLPVCAAIDYAHRNFVVHRDLKPGNILVDADGTPKLLDFGICKLLYSDPLATADTSAGMLTPDYASPEQVRGDPVTIASDVYSLGAVLYELLTGVRPHRITRYTPQAIERAICDDDVLKPSIIPLDKSTARKLHGDLDNIVLRAMDKEPERRYESATQLADDLRRYLENEPVQARPATLRYRALKFARRNRVVLTAVAAVFATLLAGVTVSLREARLAEQRLQQVRTLANKFIFDVHDSVRSLPGSTKARQLILQTGLQYLDSVAKGSKDDPVYQKELASAYRRIGDVQGSVDGSNLGNTGAAIASYQKAIALLDDAARKAPRDAQIQVERVRAYHRLGGIYAAERSLADALKMLDAAQTGGEQFLTVQDDLDLRAELGNVLIESSGAERNLGKTADALAKAQKALLYFEQVRQARPNETEAMQAVSGAHASVGMALASQNHLPDALSHFQTNAALMEQVVQREPKYHPYKRELMLAYGHIADTLGNPNLQNLGDTAGALEMYRKASELGRMIYESDPADQRAATDYGISLSRVATVMPDAPPEPKLEVERTSMRLFKDILAVNARNNVARLYIAFLSDQMGDVYRAAGDLSAAEASYRECLTAADQIIASGQTSSVIQFVKSSGKLGTLLAAKGNRKVAVEVAERGIQAAEGVKSAPTRVLIIPRAYAGVGATYAALAHSPAARPEDARAAVEWFQRSLDGWHAAQTQPSFGLPHKKEMKDVEAALLRVKTK